MQQDDTLKVNANRSLKESGAVPNTVARRDLAKLAEDLGPTRKVVLHEDTKSVSVLDYMPG